MHVPCIIPCMVQAYSMHSTGVFHVVQTCFMHVPCMVHAYSLCIICIHVDLPEYSV